MSDMREEPGDEINLLDIAITIKQNLKLLVLWPVAAGVVAWGGSFLIAPTFTASTSFLPLQQHGVAAVTLQRLGGGDLAAQYVGLMNSRSVQDVLVKRFDLRKRYEAKLHEEALRTLGSAVRISADKDGLIKVKVDDRESVFAAQLANGYVEELRKLLDRLAVTDAQQRRMFYDKQLEQTNAKLAVAAAAWRVGHENPDALSADTRVVAEAYARLRASVTGAYVRLQSMRPYMSTESPEFKLAQSELSTLRAQLSKADAIKNTAIEDDLMVRYREFKYQQFLSEAFVMQLELAKLDEALDGALIQVVDIAQTPERPSKPKRVLIVVSTALATAFALLLFVFIREAWRNSLKDKATAQKLKQLF